MEEKADARCNVVYFCASADEDVTELHHSSSPPEAVKGSELSALAIVKQNTRLLLDRDQGGFDQGE